MASISQMEEVAKMQVASSFEIDDMEAVVSELDSDFAMQADVPTDSELDGSLLYQGDMPEPSEQMSPESIAGWMVRRLSRRIYSVVISGSKALRRYYVMREIMRGTVLVCQRSGHDRRRAMSMLHDIRDLSDHSSSNDSQRDPMALWRTSPVIYLVMMAWIFLRHFRKISMIAMNVSMAQWTMSKVSH